MKRNEVSACLEVQIAEYSPSSLQERFFIEMRDILREIIAVGFAIKWHSWKKKR